MYSWSEIVYLYGAGNCLVFTLTIHSLAKFKIALILSVQLFGKPSFTKTHHQGVSDGEDGEADDNDYVDDDYGDVAGNHSNNINGDDMKVIVRMMMMMVVKKDV